MSQRQTDLVLLYHGGWSSSSRGVAFPVVLRNKGVGTFWDVALRVLHQGDETDRTVVRQIGPESESGQIFLLVPASCCDEGTPGVGLRPRGLVVAEALLDGEVVASVGLPSSGEPPRVTRVPRNADEEATLLDGRQPGWEYLWFVAVLLREMNLLEPKYRDQEIGFAAPMPGRALPSDEVMGVVGEAIDETLTLVGNVQRLFDPKIKERAFGAPGEPGDPERIEHLASRVIAVYSGLLDWAARVRGMPVEEEFRNVTNIVSRFADAPLQQFREFVQNAVSQADPLPELLAQEGHGPIRLDFTLTLDVDQTVMDEYSYELTRLKQVYGIED